MRNKIAYVIEKIIGWTALIMLLLGALSVFVYIVAICIGSSLGAEIIDVMNNIFFRALNYCASSFAILGLVKMYIKGEKELAMKSKKEKSANQDSNGAANTNQDSVEDGHATHIAEQNASEEEQNEETKE